MFLTPKQLARLSLIAIVLLIFLLASSARAQKAHAGWPFGSTNLAVEPPEMLYAGWLHTRFSEQYACEVIRTSDIIELDARALEKFQGLECAQSFTGDLVYYTVMFTWNCMWQDPDAECTYWDNHMYGAKERVPDEALLHHIRDGGYTCIKNGVPINTTWQAGDVWDTIHLKDDNTYNACGSIGARGLGTHQFVNPSHSWTKKSVMRYVDRRSAQGYKFARIDETTVTWDLDWDDVVEYPLNIGLPQSPAEPWLSWRENKDLPNFIQYTKDQGQLLRLMRLQEPWIATCPSISDFWAEEAMRLIGPAGCGSAENFPAGRGLVANWGNAETVAQARAKYGVALMNTEPDDARPNNFIIGMRYEQKVRNVEGISMLMKRGREHNRPNLIWLFGCHCLAGAELQEAVGSGKDRVYCYDHWGSYRDPVSGRLPPWCKK